MTRIRKRWLVAGGVAVGGATAVGIVTAARALAAYAAEVADDGAGTPVEDGIPADGIAEDDRRG